MQFHGFQYLQSYAAITPILEHFITPKVKSSYQKSHPVSQSLITMNPLSVPVDLPVFDVSHQRNHTNSVAFCGQLFTYRIFTCRYVAGSPTCP